APGFARLDEVTLPLVGREGGKLWQQLVDTIAERWDDVIDALDDLVSTPRVDMTALAAAEKEAQELAARKDAAAVAAGDVGDDDGVDDRELDAVHDDDDGEDGGDEAAHDRPPGGESDESDDARGDEPEPTFWEQVGIDPIRIVTAEGELLTL